MMVALRSSRLEALFGGQLEHVQYPQIRTLIDNQIPEAFDLDYKSELYGSSDKDKRDAATDVAALANTAGGVLALGVAEDDQARAAAIAGVPLSDAEERRIRQIVGSRVVPLPVLDFARAENPDLVGHGVLLIAVPRSPLAPHAVIVNDGLRYPRRNGATTYYLSEPEVATAYRDRFAATRGQVDRAEQIERGALRLLSTADDQLWIVVSLVPDFPGEMVIDQAALAAVRTELTGKHPMILPTGLQWARVNIGRRRVLADGTIDNSRLARFLAAELHHDGAGIFSAFVLSRSATPISEAPSEPELRNVSDEHVVNGILSGLRFLARHARDRAMAGGNALVRVQLYPVNRQQPVQRSHNRTGFTDRLGTKSMVDAPEAAERVVPIESLALDGPELVSAAYLLATDVFQEFGCAEAAQLNRGGGVRLPYWNQEWQARVRAWAEGAGIAVTDEQLSG